MRNRRSMAKPVKAPEFLNSVFDCTVCGGCFKVTRRTSISVASTGVLSVGCPYCKELTPLDNDIHKNFKERLVTFVNSQVAPIKAIQDPSVRFPMMRLLDSINNLLHD